MNTYLHCLYIFVDDNSYSDNLMEAILYLVYSSPCLLFVELTPISLGVIYASTSISESSTAYPILDTAVKRLLSAVEPETAVLWQLHYNQYGRAPRTLEPSPRTKPSQRPTSPVTDAEKGGIIVLPPPSLDLAFDDSVVDTVKEAWAQIVGVDLNAGEDGDEAGSEFMAFDRPGDGENQED